MKWLLIIPVVFCCFFISCKKNPPKAVTGTEKLFTYTGLTSDVSTLKHGNVTNIKATVTGAVTYSWSCSSGDIFGSGNNVLFGASTCCTGGHTITCTVSDSNKNTESKSVFINVY